MFCCCFLFLLFLLRSNALKKHHRPAILLYPSWSLLLSYLAHRIQNSNQNFHEAHPYTASNLFKYMVRCILHLEKKEEENLKSKLFLFYSFFGWIGLSPSSWQVGHEKVSIKMSKLTNHEWIQSEEKRRKSCKLSQKAKYRLFETYIHLIYIYP